MTENLTVHNINPMLIPGLEGPLSKESDTKKRLTQAIAEAWEIPEDKVLGCTLVLDKVHPSSKSTNGERVKIPGERHIPYADARKFYFYVMKEIKNYSWKELTLITGRKQAAMRHNIKWAKIHMEQEKAYLMKAELVLSKIDKDLIIFPKPTITYEANATVTGSPGVHGDTPKIQCSEAGQ